MSLKELGPDSTGADISKELVLSIPLRDRQVIILATTYFWLKYQRQNEQQEDYTPPSPSFNTTDPEWIQIIREARRIQKDRHGDVDGDSVMAYATAILQHPQRSELFGELSDGQITGICSSLDDMFENQEFCAFCEGWSLWDDESPTEFTLETTAYILSLARSVNMPWFQQIRKHSIRRAIVEGVLKYTVKSNTNLTSDNIPLLPRLSQQSDE